jgi:hypothetical protein
MVRIAAESAQNFMTSHNLAIVFGMISISAFLLSIAATHCVGPGLIRPQVETLASSMLMPIAHSAIEALITHYARIFKEEKPFCALTPSFTLPTFVEIVCYVIFAID